MSASPKSAGKAAARAQPRPRLNPTMACDTAFRIVARRHLEDLSASHPATCRGDPVALHQMRIALTRLRTAISFFSPMVADAEWTKIKRELKWLNAHLGAVRDLDVAIERLARLKTKAEGTTRSHALESEAREGHQRLARTLRSARCRRLVKSASGWAENGPWSIAKGKQAAGQRASPISVFCADKLARWQRKLLKKSRKLGNMGKKKRHRLRLMNKKLYYSVECFEDLFPGADSSKQRNALKYLSKAQKSLGQLNDDATGRSLAAALERDRVRATARILGPRREKRLVRRAAAAYRKLAGLKPPFGK